MQAVTWGGSRSRVDSIQLFALNFYKQVVSVCSLEPANSSKDLLTTNASALTKVLSDNRTGNNGLNSICNAIECINPISKE